MSGPNRWLVFALIGLLGLGVLAGVFWVGMRVGEARTGLMRYQPWPPSPRVFGFNRFPFFGHVELPHGAIGTVDKIEGNTLVLTGRGRKTGTILVSDTTIIEKGRTKISLQDIKVGDRLIVIGAPTSDGKIDAKVIRVFAPDKGSWKFRIWPGMGASMS